ncbi:MAG: nuclear transport factor 2 family protein [Acidobacteriota bacterium]|nr:nuclear transport factor 2 family protein [Acidobacteriota bacterium]
MQASSTTGPVSYDEVKVRVYGDTAVITGRVTTEEKVQSRFTRVWVKQQGRWQLVSAQSTRIIS